MKLESPEPVVPLFNPAEWKDLLVELFTKCPSTKVLSFYCTERKPVKIHCTTNGSVEKELFVHPQPTPDFLGCSELGVVRYVPIPVSFSLGDAKKYWLVVDSILRRGYLLPFSVSLESRSLSGAVGWRVAAMAE